MRKLHVCVPFLLTALLVIVALGDVHPVFARSQGGSGPFVNFFPVYPGHNNGDALGAVGSHASIHASSLGAIPTWDATSSHDIDIFLVDVNTEESSLQCSSYTEYIGTTQLSTNNGGSFTYDFVWPIRLTTKFLGGPVFATCLREHFAGATEYYSATSANAAGNPGTFTVVTDAPASLTVSPAVVNPGGTVTVTGHNWAPDYADNADDHITVSIGTCNSGNVLGSRSNILPNGSGAFSVTFTLTADTLAGKYQACAISHGASQVVDGTSGAPSFQVALAPTATPVPTATTVPTETPAPTATTVAAGTTTSTNGNTTSSGGSDNSVLIAAIIALFALLALGGALLYFFLSRRGGSPPPPMDTGVPPFGGNPSSPDWSTTTQPNFDPAVTGKRPAAWGQQAPLPPDENTQQGPPVIWG